MLIVCDGPLPWFTTYPKQTNSFSIKPPATYKSKLFSCIIYHLTEWFCFSLCCRFLYPWFTKMIKVLQLGFTPNAFFIGKIPREMCVRSTMARTYAGYKARPYIWIKRLTYFLSMFIYHWNSIWIIFNLAQMLSSFFSFWWTKKSGKADYLKS